MPFFLDLLYVAGGALAAPYALARAAFSERWRAGWRQRLGAAPALPGDRRRLWLHCASVGEALSVKAFLARLRDALPDWEIVLSVNTNTGMAIAQKRYPDLTAFYYPFDCTWCVRRAWERIQPSALVLFELEVWPHMMQEAARRGAPVVIVNGRINPKTVRAHRALKWIAGDFWSVGEKNLYGVQNETYAERFASLGAPRERIRVTGNVKYDNIHTTPDEEAVAHLQRLFQIQEGDRVVVGGSTWDGEEQALLDAYAALQPEFENLRLILTPRHVERADAVAGLAAKAGYPVVRKTELDQTRAPAEIPRDAVILVDTVGDLATVYALATVAFVGKSLAPLGGQNMLEPAGLGRPVLMGPHTFNFQEETRLLLDKQAAICINNSFELAAAIAQLLRHPDEAEAMGRRAQQVVLENKGAAERSVSLVVEALS